MTLIDINQKVQTGKSARVTREGDRVRIEWGSFSISIPRAEAERLAKELTTRRKVT